MLLLPPVEFLRHAVGNVKQERRTVLGLKKSTAPSSSAAHHSAPLPALQYASMPAAALQRQSHHISTALAAMDYAQQHPAGTAASGGVTAAQ